MCSPVSPEGAGGDAAAGETPDYLGDEVRLGLFRINAEYLGRQWFLLGEGIEAGGPAAVLEDAMWSSARPHR